VNFCQIELLGQEAPEGSWLHLHAGAGETSSPLLLASLLFCFHCPHGRELVVSCRLDLL